MRYRIPEDVVSREVGGEAILLNLATGMYFGLDGIGTEIWTMLAREGTVEAVTNALLQFHLSGADDMALGGDLAYWYGKNGGFTGISLQAAEQVIGAAGFGSEAQQLHTFSGLQDGFVKLQ